MISAMILRAVFAVIYFQTRFTLRLKCNVYSKVVLMPATLKT